MRRFFIKFEKLHFGPILGTFGTKSLKRFFCKNSPAPILFKVRCCPKVMEKIRTCKKSKLKANGQTGGGYFTGSSLRGT